MSRLIEPQTTAAHAAGQETEEGKLGRIAKYVPAEFLAFYAAWVEGVATFGFAKEIALLLTVLGIVIGLILTPIYFLHFFEGQPVKVRRAHAVVSTLAFFTYAYSLSAMTIPTWVHPGVCLLLTAITTLLSAFVRPIV